MIKILIISTYLICSFNAINATPNNLSQNDIHPDSIISPSIDVTISNQHTNNLYKNSSKIEDFSSSIKSSFLFYPSDKFTFDFNTNYTNYDKNSNLSNLLIGAGFNFIPLSDSSDFTLLINGNIFSYRYKSSFTSISSEFSNKDINGIISLGYQLDGKTYLRSGFNYLLTGYASDSVTDKKSHNIFAGVNYSLLGSNSIDIEAGYSFEKYDYLPEFITFFDTLQVHYGLAGRNGYELFKQSNLNSFYISLRYSRPIGDKTGISVIYSFREFIEKQDSALLLGYSTNYLSPWLSSYQGNSIQTKIKTYLIPRSIISIGIGYWNSSYLKTLEGVEGIDFNMQPILDILTVNGEDRHDDKYRIFATFSTPIATSSGRLFEPTLSFDYTDNKSNIANYTYTDFTVSMSLNLR